jgi:formamidopyrimidine-DNA glycosylase
MPELPEVETIRRQLSVKLKGATIREVKVFLPKILRGVSRSAFKKKLKGERIESVDRRGKILIINLSAGNSLLIHLKLTGQLIYKKNSSKLKHTHVIFHFNHRYSLSFCDLRQFGYLLLVPTSKLFSREELRKLGPEPLDKNFSFPKFKALLEQRKRARIKLALINQEFIAGIGNLYSDEILFRARVHPLRSVATLSEEEKLAIYQNIKKVLREAIKYKGSSVDAGYRDTKAQKGSYQTKLFVYRRHGEKCFVCGREISRLAINARHTHFCSSCQH